MTTWIRFIRDEEEGQERVELAFKSLMTSVYRGSELDQVVGGVVDNMKFQIENPALLNSRFVFDEVLYLDVNFHQLNLTRDWSGLEFPVSIKDIRKFQTRNNVSVNVLAVEGRDIYVHRKGRRMGPQD